MTLLFKHIWSLSLSKGVSLRMTNAIKQIFALKGQPNSAQWQRLGLTDATHTPFFLTKTDRFL